MGESDPDRHLAAGAGAPADPDDADERRSSASDPGLGEVDDPPDAPVALVDPPAPVGSPMPPVVDRDLVEAVVDFLQDLVEGDDADPASAAGDCVHDRVRRDAGDDTGGRTGTP